MSGHVDRYNVAENSALLFCIKQAHTGILGMSKKRRESGTSYLA
jgi:hypothetical protein